ncbi:type II secretion system F family protein [Falsarthrobacter nasiphocae]|uniref:Flp pilus assembly protein TadB n=1 Tax=Falsarthrobacter nasiphocae TaxID=189863 RepID=A0AAE3YHN3_9MICC|nr:type II secretion system F family protein [Falsarthrobacter nasiphocae]MDR6892354.1 Flp pilus assembly protein TadB [Falsarthrobacter nasiphocae]
MNGTRAAEDPGLVLLLLGSLLDTGCSVPAALRHLAPHCAEATHSQLTSVGKALELGLTWDEAWDCLDGEDPTPACVLIRGCLASVVDSGVPAAAVIRRTAAWHRGAWAAQAQRQAAEAGVALLVPLALCGLPAFLLVGVGLFALALARQTGLGP